MNSENVNQYIFSVVLLIMFLSTLTGMSVIELEHDIVLDYLFIAPLFLAIYTRRKYALLGGFAWAVSVFLGGTQEFVNLYFIPAPVVAISIRMVTASAFYTATQSKLIDNTVSVKKAVRFGIFNGLLIYFSLMIAGYSLTYSPYWIQSHLDVLIYNKFLLEALFGVCLYFLIINKLKVSVINQRDIRPKFMVDDIELEEGEVYISCQSLHLSKYKSILSDLNLDYENEITGKININDLSDWALLIKEVGKPIAVWENSVGEVNIFILDKSECIKDYMNVNIC